MCIGVVNRGANDNAIERQAIPVRCITSPIRWIVASAGSVHAVTPISRCITGGVKVPQPPMERVPMPRSSTPMPTHMTMSSPVATTVTTAVDQNNLHITINGESGTLATV